MTAPIPIPLIADSTKGIERSDSSGSISSELNLILPGKDDFTYTSAEDTPDSDSEDGSSTEYEDSYSDFTLGSEFDSDSSDEWETEDEDDDEFGKVLFHPRGDKGDTFLGQPIPTILLFAPAADNLYKGPVNINVVRRKYLWATRYLQKGRHGNWVPPTVLPTTRPPVPRVPIPRVPVPNPVPRVYDGPMSFYEAHKELFATLPTCLAGPDPLIGGVPTRRLPTPVPATPTGENKPTNPSPRISFAANASGPRITFADRATKTPIPQSTGINATYPPAPVKPLPFLPAPRPAYVKVYGQIKATSVGVKYRLMGMLEKKEKKKEMKDWREMYPELME